MPTTLTPLGAEGSITVSGDLTSWVRLAHITRMQYVLVEDFKKLPTIMIMEPSKTERTLIIGPHVEAVYGGNPTSSRTPSADAWQHIFVEFDEHNTWLAATVTPGGSQAWSADGNIAWLPQPSEGFNSTEAAHIYGVQLESSKSMKSWRSYRQKENSLTLEQANNVTKEVLNTLALIKGYEDVQITALQMLRNNHEEEYEKMLEAAQVEKALRSGWHIPQEYV